VGSDIRAKFRIFESGIVGIHYALATVSLSLDEARYKRITEYDEEGK
jgi:hypothetical protein